ncbi:hypothetical protein [Enterococcus olivae]
MIETDLKELVMLLQPPKSDDTEYKETYDKMIDFAINKVRKDVASYTNIPIDELPDSLTETMAMMCFGLLEAFGLVNDEDANADDLIKQTTEGDTTVAYVDRRTRLAQAMAVNSITSDFTAALNRVRRVVF